MSLVDYGLIALITLAAVRAAVYVYTQKKRGNCFGCGGSCSSCSSCKTADRKTK